MNYIDIKKEMAINQDIKCLIFSSELNPEYFQKLVKGNNNTILTEVRQQAAALQMRGRRTDRSSFRRRDQGNARARGCYRKCKDKTGSRHHPERLRFCSDRRRETKPFS